MARAERDSLDSPIFGGEVSRVYIGKHDFQAAVAEGKIIRKEGRKFYVLHPTASAQSFADGLNRTRRMRQQGKRSAKT